MLGNIQYIEIFIIKLHWKNIVPWDPNVFLIEFLADVVYGTGVWTMEMVANYPHIECIRCDIQTMFSQDTATSKFATD